MPSILKNAVYKSLKGVLHDFFEDTCLDQLRLDVLGNLFEESSVDLRDLRLRRDLFNALDLPAALRGGYVGHIRIEGLAGFAAGGKLNVIVENVCVVLAPQGGRHSESGVRRAR